MNIQLPVGQVVLPKRAEAKPAKQKRQVAQPDPDFKTLAMIEQEYIEAALAKYKNNKDLTARALGISVKTLYNKLHSYGLFEKYATV